jgi:RNA polymerase sigma factor (sigma-70 family)
LNDDSLPPPSELESTAALLDLVRQGDRAARERLASRYLQVMKRFAHGRLPSRARDLVDTDDLVQISVVRALNHVDGFESRREGAFLAYLRRTLLNQIQDQIRRAGRQPGGTEVVEDLAWQGRSPVEDAIGRETLERYEAGLSRLPEEQREAVVLRLEMGFTYRQIADALGSDSPNAVRMMVTRALVRIGEQMGDGTKAD